MTETELRLSEMQKVVGHLTDVSEQGWQLSWGETPDTVFEIVCRKANALQVEKLDNLVTEGHRKALTLLK